MDSPGLSWLLLSSPGLYWALLGSHGLPGLSWALLGSHGRSIAVFVACTRSFNKNQRRISKQYLLFSYYNHNGRKRRVHRNRYMPSYEVFVKFSNDSLYFGKKQRCVFIWFFKNVGSHEKRVQTIVLLWFYHTLRGHWFLCRI